MADHAFWSARLVEFERISSPKHDANGRPYRPLRADYSSAGWLGGQLAGRRSRWQLTDGPGPGTTEDFKTNAMLSALAGLQCQPEPDAWMLWLDHVLEDNPPSVWDSGDSVTGDCHPSEELTTYQWTSVAACEASVRLCRRLHAEAVIIEAAPPQSGLSSIASEAQRIDCDQQACALTVQEASSTANAPLVVHYLSQEIARWFVPPLELTEAPVGEHPEGVARQAYPSHRYRKDDPDHPRTVNNPKEDAELDSAEWKHTPDPKAWDASGNTAPPPSTALISPTKWEDVELRFLSEQALQVVLGGQLQPKQNFAEMGFEDRRTGGKPTKAWETFLEIARGNGVLKVDRSPRGYQAQASRVGEIRRILRSKFSIERNPLPAGEDYYRAQFKTTRAGAFDDDR